MELDDGSSPHNRGRPPRARSKTRSRIRTNSHSRDTDPPPVPPADPFATPSDPAMLTDKLLVRNVPAELFSPSSLTAHFSVIPSVSVINVSLRGTPDSTRRTAVVTFASPSDATAAMTKGRQYANSTLQLSYFRGPAHNNAPSTQAQQSIPTNELLFSYVPKDLYSRTALQELFEPISDRGVISVSIKQRIHRDGMKRTAIITFASIQNAEMALRNLPTHNGQKLQVTFRGPPVLPSGPSHERGAPMETWYPEPHAKSTPSDPFAQQYGPSDMERKNSQPGPFSAGPSKHSDPFRPSTPYGSGGAMSDPFASHPAAGGDPFEGQSAPAFDPFKQPPAPVTQLNQPPAMTQPFNVQSVNPSSAFTNQPAGFSDPFSNQQPSPPDPFTSHPPLQNDPFANNAQATLSSRSRPLDGMTGRESSQWPSNSFPSTQAWPSVPGATQNFPSEAIASASQSNMTISADGMDTQEEAPPTVELPRRLVKEEPQLVEDPETFPEPNENKVGAVDKPGRFAIQENIIDHKAEIARLRASIAEKEALKERIARKRAETRVANQQKTPKRLSRSLHAPESSPTKATPKWREVGKRMQLKHAKDFVGTCITMCPAEEIEVRKQQGDISVYEMMKGSRGKADPEKMVKKYRRSAAIAEQPKPSDVRPPKVLVQTMDYLKGVCDTRGAKFVDIHNFVRDRTRSLRQDFTLQGVRDESSIKVHEESVRFHIMSAHRLHGTDPSMFSAKQNYEQLDKCLVSLREMYGLRREQKLPMSPNEPEMQCYFILRNIDDHKGIVELLLRLSEEVRHSLPVQFALQVFQAASSSFSNAATFFSCVRAAPYLMACLMHSKFAELRRRALTSMNASNGSKRCKDAIDVPVLSTRLGFDRDGEAVDFFNLLGMAIHPEDGYGLDPSQLEVHTPSRRFSVKDIQWVPKKSALFVEKKARKNSEIITGNAKYDFDMAALPKSVLYRLKKHPVVADFLRSTEPTTVTDSLIPQTHTGVPPVPVEPLITTSGSNSVKPSSENRLNSEIQPVPPTSAATSSGQVAPPTGVFPIVKTGPQTETAVHAPSQPFIQQFVPSTNVHTQVKVDREWVNRGQSKPTLTIPAPHGFSSAPRGPGMGISQTQDDLENQMKPTPSASYEWNKVGETVQQHPSNIPSIDPKPVVEESPRETKVDNETVTSSSPKPVPDLKSISMRELNVIREEAAEIILKGHQALEPIQKFTDTFWTDTDLTSVRKQCDDAFAIIEDFAQKLSAITSKAKEFKETCSDTEETKQNLLIQLEKVRDIGHDIWKKVWGIMGRVHLKIADSNNPWFPRYEESTPVTKQLKPSIPPKPSEKLNIFETSPEAASAVAGKKTTRGVDLLHKEMIRHGLPRWQAVVFELTIAQKSGRGLALKWLEQELSADGSVGTRHDSKIINLYVSNEAKYSVRKVQSDSPIPRSANLVICGIDIPEKPTFDQRLFERLKNMLSRQRSLSVDTGLPPPRLILALAHSSGNCVVAEEDTRTAEFITNLQLGFLHSSCLISSYKVVPIFKNLSKPREPRISFNKVFLASVVEIRTDLERVGLGAHVNLLGDRLVEDGNSAWMRFMSTIRTGERTSAYEQVINAINQAWSGIATMLEREVFRCPEEFKAEISHLRTIQRFTQKVRLPRGQIIRACTAEEYIVQMAEMLQVFPPVQNLDARSPLSHFCHALGQIIRPYVSFCLAGMYSTSFLLPQSAKSDEDATIFSHMSRSTFEVNGNSRAPEHVERAWDGTPVKTNCVNRKRTDFKNEVQSVPPGKRMRSHSATDGEVISRRPTRRISDYSLKRTLEFSPSPPKRRCSLPMMGKYGNTTSRSGVIKRMYEAELNQLKMIDDTIHQLTALRSCYA